MEDVAVGGGAGPVGLVSVGEGAMPLGCAGGAAIAPGWRSPRELDTRCAMDMGSGVPAKNFMLS